MTHTDDLPAPDADSPRGSRQLIGLGIGALVIVAAIAAFVFLGDDDGSESVSTGSDPAVETPVDTAATTTEAAVEPPPATEPPATEPPATEPPATEPPATEPPATEPPASDTATYQVTLTASWVADTHPSTLPGNAHFSDPVLGVHEAAGAMFVLGQAASPGIEEMAEAGRTSTLLDELRSTAGVSFADSTSGIEAPATESRTFDITVSQTAPLVSLVTMLAPSPDWFVGFADRDLFVDDQWVEAITFDLGNYDAGTDSGPDFTSDNAATDPAEPIDAPRDAAFAAAAAEGTFGTVTITRTG